MNKLHYKGYLKTKRVKYLVVYNASIFNLDKMRRETVVGNCTLTISGQFNRDKAEKYLEEKNDLQSLVITNLIKL